MSEVKEVKQLESPDEVKKMAKYLYHTVQMREAVQLSKRVEYFRGRKLVEVLTKANGIGLSEEAKLRHKKDRHAPAITSEEDALLIGKALLQHGFIHASKVKNPAKRELEPVRASEFTSDGYYTWIFQASSVKRNLLLGLIIFGFLSLVMFPVWPNQMKVGVWYLSVTFLLVFFVVIIVRLVVYFLLWMVGIEFWIFPNLFDDDASITESFIPMISYKMGDKSIESWTSRAIGLAATIGFAIWAYNQPTEFDEIMVIQKQFVSDLYEGKLLSDESQNPQDQWNRMVPDLEELQRELEKDEDEDFIDSFQDSEETDYVKPEADDKEEL